MKSLLQKKTEGEKNQNITKWHKTSSREEIHGSRIGRREKLCKDERNRKRQTQHQKTNIKTLFSYIQIILNIGRIMLHKYCFLKQWYTYLILVMFILGIESAADPLDGAKRPCLTGFFTDVQGWVFENGSLTPDLDPSLSIDLSDNPTAVDQLRLLMDYYESFYKAPPQTHTNESEEIFMDSAEEEDEESITVESLTNVVYLSLARNKLYRIPLFYSSLSGTATLGFPNLHFLSFYGNNFGYNPVANTLTNANYDFFINATNLQEVTVNNERQSDKSNWASDLQQVYMVNLLELDLRNCGLEYIENDTFIHLKNLRRLYLSHNSIRTIQADSFNTLINLVHLDLSFNTNGKDSATLADSVTIDKGAFKPLTKLKSLDLSFTKLTTGSTTRISEFGRSLHRLSICYTKFTAISRGFFSKTSIRFIDMSGNIALEAFGTGSFEGIENKLEVLNANRLGIKNTSWVMNMGHLRVLSLTDNDIVNLVPEHFENLLLLDVIDLTNNRISNWNSPLFPKFTAIQLMMLGGNNLNLMTTTMIQDFSKVRFLGIANNKFVCNCDLRDFVLKGIQNSQDNDELENATIWEEKEDDFNYMMNGTYSDISEFIFYLDVRRYYDSIIEQRINVADFLNDSQRVHSEKVITYANTKQIANFSTIFIDYLNQKGLCTDPRSGAMSSAHNITCEVLQGYGNVVSTSTFLIVGLVVIAVVIVVTLLVFWKWWYIRYFFLMIKNAAILSVMGNADGNEDEEKVFTYDVFVSYCDEDRRWVLEHLLPEVEQNTPISICLHERDFQVGLSIFENIISSMDRSRTLMMVVSNHFLLSQWCQFEMHLAQHRLLETRREQLILVLLEDIPRRKRPNTLHYLMMTKTYIVWPGKKSSEQPEFWKRLKKALMHGKSFDKCSTA